MVKNRVAWVSAYLPSSKPDDGAVITFAAALTIFMGFGAMRMMESGGARPDADVGSWLPSDSFTQPYRPAQRAPAPSGSYLLPEPEKQQPARASAVTDSVHAVAPNKGFTPMTDPAVSALVGRGAGASEVANGTPGSGAQAQAKPAPAAQAAAQPVRTGESRAFVSGRVNRAAASSRFRQAAVGSVGGGTNFGGSSAGAAFDVVAGPSAGTTVGGAGAANLRTGATDAGTLDGFDAGLNGGANNQSLVGGGGSTGQGMRSATESEIAEQRRLLTNSDGRLRAQVAIPAVQLLSSMLQAISNGADHRTLMFVSQSVQSQTQLDPPPAQAQSLLNSSVPCLQELAGESDLPADPQNALLCHVQASSALHPYDSWPGQLSGAYKPFGDILKNNPAWSFVSGSAGDYRSWAATTNTSLQDAQNLVMWAHTVKLPSWEPAFEQNLDGAISHLQSAKAAWDQLSTSADANKGTFLAFGSQETTAGLASLDQALRSMGGAVPASDGKCFGSQAYAPDEITHACWR